MSEQFIDRAFEELDLGVLEIELDSKAADRVYVHHFKSIYPGEGNARLAMEVLTRLADEMGVRLALYPFAEFGPKYLTQEELVDWYKRLGFLHRGVADEHLEGQFERPPSARPSIDTSALPHP